MPAPYARRDWQTRADRALGRVGRGSQQGRFPGTRPVPPSSIGGPSRLIDYRDSGQLHKVDTFSITGTGTAAFNLSYPPLDDSWNVMLNGLRVHSTEFSISSNVLTVTTPTDLFKGVTSQGSPWALEAQYDYLVDISLAPEITAARYREVTKGDATSFWPVGYDDSAWTAAATPEVSFAGGSGSLPSHVYSWDPTFDLQVRATVTALAGESVAVAVTINDNVSVYWNGTLAGSSGIGGTTVNIAGADVLSSNVLALKADDTNPISAWLFATVS